MLVLSPDCHCEPTDPCQDSMSDQERETEDEGWGTSDTAPMLPRRPADHRTSAKTYIQLPGLATRSLRTLLLLGQAVAWLLLHLVLPGTVFLLVLLPAAAVVYLGFLCHSRVSSGLQGRGPWGVGVLKRFRALGWKRSAPFQHCLLVPRHTCPSPGTPSSPAQPPS